MTEAPVCQGNEPGSPGSSPEGSECRAGCSGSDPGGGETRAGRVAWPGLAAAAWVRLPCPIMVTRIGNGNGVHASAPTPPAGMTVASSRRGGGGAGPIRLHPLAPRSPEGDAGTRGSSEEGERGHRGGQSRCTEWLLLHRRLLVTALPSRPAEGTGRPAGCPRGPFRGEARSGEEENACFLDFPAITNHHFGNGLVASLPKKSLHSLVCPCEEEPLCLSCSCYLPFKKIRTRVLFAVCLSRVTLLLGRMQASWRGEPSAMPCPAASL